MLRKLLIIIMGIFLVICAGSCNLYPLYVKQMKDKFGFSLTEINLFGSFINLGLWAAFTMGFVYDKWGPKISCIIGAILLSGSYTVLYLIMNSSLTSVSIVPMLLLALIMGQGSALCYTTAVTTNLKNFRIKETSLIVGLLVSNLAISPSIFTTYREALKDVVDINNFFLIIATFLAVIIVICGFVFTNIRNLYSNELAEFEKYKEKKVVILLVILNIFTLMVYTFGVVFNNLKSDNRFPNIIVYPCLQALNFSFIIMEQFGFFDKIYFKIFIEKKIKEKMKTEADGARRRELSQPLEERKESSFNREGFNKMKDELDVPMPIQEKGNKSFREKAFNYEDIDLNTKQPNNTLAGTFGLRNRGIIERGLRNSVDKIKEEDSRMEEKSYENEFKINPVNVDEQGSEADKNHSHNQTKDVNPNSEEKIDEHIDVIENPNITFDKGLSEFQKFLLIVKDSEILILFTMLILGIGSVISNLNNIEFIVISITTAPTSRTISEYAIVYFVFNSFSRILSGILIDKLIKWKKFYHFLIFLSCVGLISQILGIVMDKEILFLSLALAGTTHGGYMTFTPIYTRTKYGLDNMGKILGFLTTGCAIGSILIADLIFTIFYDIYLEDNKCIGKRCFRGSYIISSVFFTINIIFAVYLYRKNR
jgi:hypothetical protein